MRLLIADDDNIMRDQLKNKIPWKENGYEVVGIAADGKEAYELALRYCPQILVTDIKMPYISGIELVEKVRAVIPECRAVFLTGYDDFAFAREAIRLRAEDYILKGEANEKILRAVNAVADRVRENADQAHLNELGRYLKKQDTLSRLLRDAGTKEDMTENMQALGINPERFQYRIAVLKADMKRKEEGGRKPSRELQYVQETADLIREYFEQNNLSAHFLLNQQYVVMVLETEEIPEETVVRLYKKLAEELKEKTGQKITIGIGRVYEPGKEFSLYYDDAVFAAENAFIEEENVLLFQELSQSSNIRRIREYILEHYADPELSLNSLSQQLFLSPAYISSLFKRYI